MNLTVIDGHEILYLDVTESRHTFGLVSQIGIRRPLHCTSLGKIMLAFTPDQQQEHLLSGLTFGPYTPHGQRGYSTDDEDAFLDPDALVQRFLTVRDKSQRP